MKCQHTNAEGICAARAPHFIKGLWACPAHAPEAGDPGLRCKKEKCTEQREQGKSWCKDHGQCAWHDCMNPALPDFKHCKDHLCETPSLSKLVARIQQLEARIKKLEPTDRKIYSIEWKGGSFYTADDTDKIVAHPAYYNLFQGNFRINRVEAPNVTRIVYYKET